MAQGTITVTNGSKNVQGEGTNFTTFAPGSFISLTLVGVVYTIAIDKITDDTNLVLSVPFDGATTSGAAFVYSDVGSMALATMGVTVQAQKALRMMIADATNWREVYSDKQDITVTLPDGTQFSGYSWGYISLLLKEINVPLLEGLRDEAIEAKDRAVQAETQAGNYASEALSYRNDAAGAAGAAADSAGAAAGSAGNAHNSEVASANSAASAHTSEVNAQQWANSINPDRLLTKSGNLSGIANLAAARENLGIGSSSIMNLYSMRLDSKASSFNNGGILESRRLSDDLASIVSMGRIYHEVQSGVSKFTIHVNNGSGINRYFQFDQNGGVTGINNLTIGTGIAFTPKTSNIASIFCDGVIQGSEAAIVTANIQGSYWNNWRNTGSGMLIQNPDMGSASTIFKTVKFGKDWGAAMSSVISEDQNHACAIIVGGFQSTFYANGTAQGNWVSASDLRLKANINRIENPIEKIKSLSGYTYLKRGNMVEDEHSYYSEEAGLIAQDVKLVLPECVYEYGDENMLGVNYNGVTALLVNGFNEQQNQIDNLKRDIENMKQ